MAGYKWVMVLLCVGFLQAAGAQRGEAGDAPGGDATGGAAGIAAGGAAGVGMGMDASMGDVRLAFSLDGQGTPRYEVWYKDRPVILSSALGFVLQEDSLLYRGFRQLGVERKTVDEVWQPVWGEVRDIRDHYEQLLVHLQKSDLPYRRLDIVFRVFADGVGFRYMFPRQSALDYFVVSDERTQFRLAGDHKTFWIPGDYDTNEYPYSETRISKIDNKEMVDKSTDICVRDAPDRYAVQTPLMMKSDDGLYINIHEAALLHYPAMQLHVDRAGLCLSSKLVPDAVGNKAYLHTPFSTPWRTIIVSDKATDILASKMILDLNDPARIRDVSWIKPMKFVGVWWEMQTEKATWAYSDYPDSLGPDGRLIPNGRHGANTANVERYIDFAAKNGIGGVLVEGWNVGWEDWFGHWKENVFDFVTPYPDFDMKGITAYAAARGVKMIMHNETSASATNYERQMDTAFALMNRFGYTSVKTGYVGRIIPRGEHHDGQWMVDHYIRVAETAARHRVMLDAHEPVRPTGLQRTYPNWMACEAARGNEYNAFSDGNPPNHETILPFTRLMGGPMDYTPGLFRIKGYSTVAGRQVHTTLAKQLALYVTIYSPFQMAADLPENYALHMDAFQFIREVPVDWDDTRVLEAEPGEYVSIARKGKGTGDWFIGAITGSQGREAVLSLNFLDKGRRYEATIYRDGPHADWKNNPEAYVIEKKMVDAGSVLRLLLAPGGGAALSLREVR
jgi:glucan 1,4-alpha-glucosidase